MSGATLQRRTNRNVAAQESPRRTTMKQKNIILIFSSVLLFATVAAPASSSNKGIVIAMGGANGTPEIYETWKKLGGAKDAHVDLIPTANNPGDDFVHFVNGLKH